MAMAVTPTLYLSVEVKTRELDAKLLIAMAAASAGLKVVLGQQWLMNENLAAMPPGIMFFKGLNRIQVLNMRNARKCGHLVVAGDEEAMGLADAEYMNRDVHPDAAKFCDVVFAQGPRHLDALKATDFAQRSEILLTGNPRIDLLRPEFRASYEPEAAVLRERHGKFVLINTNFGGTNSAWGSVEKFRQVCINTGWLNPNNEAEVRQLEELLAWERASYAHVRAVIDQLRERVTEHTIIIRPHPSERVETWQEIFAGDPRVQVIQSGNHLSWILASAMLVHSSCTTGMEAMLLDKPVVGVCPPGYAWNDFFVANEVNLTFSDPAAAVEAVMQHLSGTGNIFTAHEARLREAARRHFTGLDGAFAFQRIADHLVDLTDRHHRREFAFTPRPAFQKSILRNDYAKRKMSADEHEIRAKLRQLAGSIGRRADLTVQTIGDSLFLIEQAR